MMVYVGEGAVLRPCNAVQPHTEMKDGEWWGGGIEPEVHLRFESLRYISPGTSVILFLEKSRKTTLLLLETGYSVCLVMFLV
jgi:hypothetical protein